MGTYPPGKGTPPQSTRFTVSRKSSFANRPGKVAYKEPAVSGPANSRFTLSKNRSSQPASTSGFRQSYLSSKEPAITRPESFQHSYRTNPYAELLMTIERTRVINIVILNETEEKVDSSVMRNIASTMPPMATRLGTLHIRYNFRVANTWKQLAEERNEGKGEYDIVVAINHDYGPAVSPNPSVATADNTRVVRPVDPNYKEQSVSRGYKINVHIPPLLLQVIANDALTFVDKIKPEAGFHPSTQSVVKYNAGQQPVRDSLDRRTMTARIGTGLTWTDSTYNKTRDRLGYVKYGIALHNKYSGLPPVTAASIAKHRAWMEKTIRAASKLQQDFELIEIATNKSVPSKLKGIGTVGNALGVSLAVYKLGTDTWTTNTLVDAGFLAAGALAGMSALILSAEVAVAVVMAVTAITVAYQLADIGSWLVTGKSFGDLWDAYFPRNKPFSPPIHSFYVPRR